MTSSVWKEHKQKELEVIKEKKLQASLEIEAKKEQKKVQQAILKKKVEEQKELELLEKQLEAEMFLSKV